MRIKKSPREIDLVRRASELAGLGIMEAIRSSGPEVMEYQLDAAARYVFELNGAQGEGYRSITASGTNAYYGHYYRNESALVDGELVLMDYAPDYRYYTSDVARMWPVNGAFDAGQRRLYGFIVDYSQALMKRIRPGVTADTIMDEAAGGNEDRARDHPVRETGLRESRPGSARFSRAYVPSRRVGGARCRQLSLEAA